MPGNDFIPTFGVLPFLTGEESKSFDLTLLDDGESEGPKTIGLRLVAADTSSLGKLLIQESLPRSIQSNPAPRSRLCRDEAEMIQLVRGGKPWGDRGEYCKSVRGRELVMEARAGDFTETNH